MMAQQSYYLAADTGGTFTDIAVLKPDGNLFVWKVPSTPEAPEEAVITGVTEAFDHIAAPLHDVTHFVHGTTVATNTVLTRTGANIGLITTEGFRDIIRIGWQARPALYDPTERNPEPLVQVKNIRQIPERMSADGQILTPLDQEALKQAHKELADSGVEAIVVSFLNSYRNSEHETQAKELLASLGPLQIIAASDLAPEIREYERTSTGTINAYVQPRISHYISELKAKSEDAGIDAPLWIMQSNGGLIAPDDAVQQAARTILSGLAGGVSGAASWARHLELDNVVSFDIGGTSTDIAMIRNGQPEETQLAQIGGLPLRIPAIDVNTIGAGGGSIAWIDSGGGLRMGPQSAGAVPGPVAYDQGGEELTVTDAHLVLGRLGENLLGGRFKLDYDKALQKMKEFAEPLGMEWAAAAEGMIKVINATMARGVRKVSVERGIDTRNCDLMAFGGAGPLHAAELLSELQMSSAVIPPQPGIASAVGMLDAPQRHDFSQAVFYREGEPLPAQAELFAGLTEQASNVELTEHAEYEFYCDARYAGQSFELTVSFFQEWENLRKTFDEAHQERYGFADEDATMEIVVLRLVATQKVRDEAGDETSAAITNQSNQNTAEPIADREVYFDGVWHEVKIYKRSDLAAEQKYVGPLILEQFDSTILVRPGQTCWQDGDGFVHLSAQEKGQ